MSKSEDTPQHQPEQTSSIGGLWPPEAGSFQRVKAIYREYITTQDQLTNVYRQFISQTMRLAEKEYLPSKLAPPTRVQFRILVEAEILKSRASDSLFSNSVEAVIPLDSGHLGSEPVLVYLSKNSFCRQPHSEDLHQIHKNIFVAQSTTPKTTDEMLTRAFVNGYKLQIVKEWTTDNIAQLANLYTRFGWELTEVQDMVKKPQNTICVAKDGDSIISAGIAEFAQINFAGKSLTMAEITEAATMEGYGGQGLYTAISATLLRYLAGLGNIDLAFGECNGLSAAVLKTAKTQGRTFATETGARYGFPESGILKQQVPIGGVERHTDYNDLIPAFLTATALKKYA